MESQEKKGDIKPRTKSSNKAATINRTKDLKQNELRMRTESWHRVRKEGHEGESECRVSKASGSCKVWAPKQIKK
jgi:hypothetical protein